MRGHRGPVTCVSFFEHDTRVAAGDARGRVLLHRVDVPNDEVSINTTIVSYNSKSIYPYILDT